MKRYLFVLLLLSSISLIQSGLNIDTLKLCCNLGTKHATSGLKCNKIETPIKGIEKRDEKYCIHSIEVCCRNQNQESQCDLGIEDAKTKKNCLESDPDVRFRKDCCDACQLGMESGAAQHSCEDSLGLGSPFDKTFVKCCKEVPITTTTSSTTTTTIKPISSTLANEDFSPPLVENVCDIGKICAHICVPTGKSYKCGCNKGFTLMADGISCKPEKRLSKKDRCSINNPCEHTCTDTGVAIKCSCRDGYELGKDKKSCKDIDECATGIHDCEKNEECINDYGGYYCEDPSFPAEGEDFDSKCPPGYKFNGEKSVCDDIDECEFDIMCPRPKTCINTIGSFKCEGKDRPQCPPGFYFKASIEDCSDIDECITGDNDCNKESQVCLNTKGNYTCIDKVSKNLCPPGFKKNSFMQNCEDINECLENDQLCAQNERCVNEPGGHTCVPTSNNIPLITSAIPQSSKPTLTTIAKDIYRSTTPIPSTTPTKPAKFPDIYRPVSCPTGYKFHSRNNSCIDIDECQDQEQCDSTQDCINTIGSFICKCKIGFTKEHQTGACVDVNECQVGSHECTVAQRCDNTVGSYLCARITGCGTGYTLNYANGLCEDDDECVLGLDNCKDLGVNFKCRNTLGSYRCDPVRPVPKITQTTSTTPITPLWNPPLRTPKWHPPITSTWTPSVTPIWNPTTPSWTYPVTTTTYYPILSGTQKRCLPGYIMNERGVCEDINECESNPCKKGQSCLNFNGRYQCISTIQCKIGYELDDSGEKCIDVNECTRGIHKCNPSQICKNGQGYYTCECPPGHHLNPSSRVCEDIDECNFYRVCSTNAECINTIGSYKCRCKEGFRESGNLCEDIDECKETSRLCEHNCVNVWGGYRCACKSGFTLNFDNRTCTDIDECEMFKDKRLCIGSCDNIPGSYKCSCPRGYRLGSDGRTCRDIDECEQNICPRHDDVCLNTRGGYKCYTISCPANYFRDSEHKGRCKRPPTLCDPRDMQCILLPEQYTYHYIALVSNLPVSDGPIQFFQIKGPQWVVARAEFSMKVVNVNSPYGVERVNDNFFKMYKLGFNTMQLYLARSIQGPQEIELKVEMHLYHGNVMSANVVTHIFILVSEYSF